MTGNGRDRDRERCRERQRQIDRQKLILNGGGMNEYGYINTWLASSLSLLCLVLSPQDNFTDLRGGPFPISQSSLETSLQTHLQACPLSHLDNSKARQVNNEGSHQKLSPTYLSITKGLPSAFSLQGCGLHDDQEPHFTDVCVWWLAPCQKQIGHLVVVYSFCRIKKYGLTRYLGSLVCG